MNPELVERLNELAKHHGPEIAAWRDWFELCERNLPRLDAVLAALHPEPDSGSETNYLDSQAELESVRGEFDALLAKHGLFEFNLGFRRLYRTIAAMQETVANALQLRERLKQQQQVRSETPAESGGAELSETPAEEIPVKRKAKN